MYKVCVKFRGPRPRVTGKRERESNLCEQDCARECRQSDCLACLTGSARRVKRVYKITQKLFRMLSFFSLTNLDKTRNRLYKDGVDCK